MPRLPKGAAGRARRPRARERSELVDGDPPRPRTGRLVGVLLLLLAVAAAAVLIVTKPFSSAHPAGGNGAEGAVATSLATVERRSLSSQQTENGTLGYAGSYTVINQAGEGGGHEGQGGEKGGGGGGGSTITSLPSVGQAVREGEVIYGVNGEPVLLLYGATPAYRTLHQDMSGKDVAELNADLVALGFATGTEIDEHLEYFSTETKAALKALQETRGLKEADGVKLGQLALGQAVFLPSTTLRITSVSGTLGGAAQQGSPIMQATSTSRQVVIKLDAAEQASIRTGDQVSITLPNSQVTPGVVSAVGKVAKSSSSGGGKGGGGEEEGTPTIEVQITPTDPRATGTLDQAPVRVAITTASVHDVLVVPISALLALAEGGYAVEVAEGRLHHLVGVTLGLFDDADGLVQVSGSGLQPGQRVVVPST